MGRLTPWARRAFDGGLIVAQVLLETVLFAAIVAGLVFLLPTKFAVLILSLYGFIVVWLLQASALLMLGLVLARLILCGARGKDSVRALMLCGGFVLAVAICNTYVLQLGEIWHRSFAVAIDNIPLAAFFDLDRPVLASIGRSSNAAALGCVAGLIFSIWRRLAKGAF